MQKVISKKIGNARIAWFENSDSWVQFEEPAWFVYESSRKGMDHSTITRDCTKKYKLPTSECDEFVSAVQEKIRHLCETASTHRETACAEVSPRDVPDLYSSRDYSVGESVFTVHYYSRTLEFYMHPPIAHLQTRARGEKKGKEFHVYEEGEMKFLLCQPGGTVHRHEEYGNLKRQLYIEIATLIHHRSSRDWMTYVHASAVCDREKTVLLASGSGSGKSTMAALLQTRGLELFSDDFVAVEACSGLAFPFPAAISIKRDARPVLEAFDKSLFSGAFTPFQKKDPPLWFIPPKNTPEGMPSPKKVKAIVFLKYDPREECNYTPLDPVNAIKLFHENARVTKDPDQISLFMDWLLEIPCGTLEYGNTEAGMDQIQKLLLR